MSIRSIARLGCTVSIVLALVVLSSQAARAVVIGTFGTPRVSTGNIATGPLTEELRASLNGNFPGSSFVTSDTLTPAFLSGIDTLIISSDAADGVPITLLTPSEQSALFNYVQGGGSALLVTEGYVVYQAAAQSIAGVFGVTVVDDGLLGVQPGHATNPSHPLIDGPFGVQSGFAVYGSGVFINLGPFATGVANMTATNLPIVAVIESGAIAPGSGRVVLVADTHPFIDTADGAAFGLQETFFLNAIDFLTVPEPASWMTGAMALVGLSLAAWRKRKANSATCVES